MSEHVYLRRRNEEIRRLRTIEGMKLEAIVVWINRNFPRHRIKRSMVSRILQRFTVGGSKL